MSSYAQVRVRSRLSPLVYFYLSLAALLTLGVFGYEEGWVFSLVARFPDPIALGAASVLGACILIVAVRQVLPIATALAHENSTIRGMKNVLAQNSEDPVKAVMLIMSLASSDASSATARTLYDLHAHLQVCKRVGSKALLGLDELCEGFAGRVGVYAPRLSRSVQFLTALGLLGTITGLVLTASGLTQLPTTDEGIRNLMFSMFHGMGIVYVSAFLAWGAAVWLYVYEMTVVRAVEEQCEDFWRMAAIVILPVINSDRFLQESEGKS